MNRQQPQSHPWRSAPIEEARAYIGRRLIAYVYRMNGADFSVGFYTPTGRWIEESAHTDKQQAAARVAYLNGKQNNVQAHQRGR